MNVQLFYYNNEGFFLIAITSTVHFTTGLYRVKITSMQTNNFFFEGLIQNFPETYYFRDCKWKPALQAEMKTDFIISNTLLFLTKSVEVPRVRREVTHDNMKKQFCCYAFSLWGRHACDELRELYGRKSWACSLGAALTVKRTTAAMYSHCTNTKPESRF